MGTGSDLTIPREAIIPVSDLDTISHKIREQLNLIKKLKIHPLLKEDLLKSVKLIENILERARLKDDDEGISSR